VSVDNRLVEYWRRQLAARRRLRPAPALPDPSPTGLAVAQPDEPVDGPAAEPGSPSNVVPMAFEDR
jgi:hypothetical protein